MLSGCHLLRAPSAGEPKLSAGIHAGTLQVDGLARRYQPYVPHERVERPPLLVLLHGSRMTGAGLRRHRLRVRSTGR